MGLKVNRAELAKCFGVSLPTVTDWIKKGCPADKQGTKGKEWQFDTAAVIAWREELLQQLLREQLQEEEKKPDPSLEYERRKQKAEALMAETKLDQLRADLVNVQDEELAWATVSATLRDAALALPDKIAPQVTALSDERQVRELMRKEIRTWLSNLPEQIRSVTAGAEAH